MHYFRVPQKAAKVHRSVFLFYRRLFCLFSGDTLSFCMPTAYLSLLFSKQELLKRQVIFFCDAQMHLENVLCLKSIPVPCNFLSIHKHAPQQTGTLSSSVSSLVPLSLLLYTPPRRQPLLPSSCLKASRVARNLSGSDPCPSRKAPYAHHHAHIICTPCASVLLTHAVVVLIRISSNRVLLPHP